MPTLRSEFTIEQFEEVLQKLAHKLPKFNKVRTDTLEITFSYDEDDKPRRISVHIHEKDSYYGIYFGIVPKAYMDSHHTTKIEMASEENKAKIEKWLQELMGSEKPIPRFTLSELKTK